MSCIFQTFLARSVCWWSAYSDTLKADIAKALESSEFSRNSLKLRHLILSNPTDCQLRDYSMNVMVEKSSSKGSARAPARSFTPIAPTKRPHRRIRPGASAALAAWPPYVLYSTSMLPRTSSGSPHCDSHDALARPHSHLQPWPRAGLLVEGASSGAAGRSPPQCLLRNERALSMRATRATSRRPEARYRLPHRPRSRRWGALIPRI